MIKHWLSLVAVSVAAGCGSEPSTPGTDRPARVERDARAGPLAAGAVRIATGTAPDGRVLRLRVIQDDAGPCVLISGVDGQLRGCGRVPSARAPRAGRAVRAEAMVARRGADHHEIFAATSARVVRVRVLVGTAGLSPRRTLLLHADDEDSLEEAGIDSGPFGYFFAEVPRTAGRIRVTAFDADGKRIGSAGFDHLTGMGERFIAG